MDTIQPTLRPAAFPAITPRTGLDALIAGVIGLLAWEMFARGIAPFWLGHALEPTGLIEMAFGIGGTGAQIIHLATGLVAFPLGYMLLVRPLAAALGAGIPVWLLGLGYGVALWVFAMVVVASLLAGMPPFLGFGAVAWASLIGHLLLGLAIALTVEYRIRAG